MKLSTYEKTSVRSQILWLLGAAVVGFGSSALFAGVLHLPRNVLVLPYVAVVTSFLYGYVLSSRVRLGMHFRDRPVPGVVGGALAAAMVVSNVLSQPASPRPEGLDLVLAVFWPGVVYGLVDGLLLSVMPVVAVRLAFQERGLTAKTSGRLAAAACALVASLTVTAAYHLGYPEFRGAQVMGPVIGNAILTGAYLLTRSPLSPILAHVAMHVASVLHGMETTIQLPPHY